MSSKLVSVVVTMAYRACWMEVDKLCIHGWGKLVRFSV